MGLYMGFWTPKKRIFGGSLENDHFGFGAKSRRILFKNVKNQRIFQMYRRCGFLWDFGPPKRGFLPIHPKTVIFGLGDLKKWLILPVLAARTGKMPGFLASGSEKLTIFAQKQEKSPPEGYVPEMGLYMGFWTPKKRIFGGSLENGHFRVSEEKQQIL